MFLSSSSNPNRLTEHFQIMKIATHYEQQAKFYRSFTEKEVLLMIIEMMAGAQNACFCLNNKKFFEKRLPSFRCSHLCQQTLDACIESCVGLGNKHQYIRSQSLRLHGETKKINSGVLQTIVEGIIEASNDFSYFLTSCSEEIYQDNGKVKIASESEAPAQTFTLISLLNRLSDHERCAGLLVSILSDLSARLPLESRDDCARCVKSMFDFYFQKTMELQGDQQAFSYVEHIFAPAIKLYLSIVIIWLRNDTFAFKALHHSGFFIDFSAFQTVLNTTRIQLLNYQQNTKDQHHLNQNLATRTQTQATLLRSDFCFKSTIPIIFCQFADIIISLGETMAFIFLYFDHNEKHKLLQYFAIQQLFLPLLSVFQSKNYHRSLKFQTNRSQKKKNFDLSTRFKFQKKARMKTKIKHQFDNNPYNMSIQTKGTFYFSQKLLRAMHQPQTKFIQNEKKDKKEQKKSFKNIFVQVLTTLKEKYQNILKEYPQKQFLDLKIDNLQRVRLAMQQTIMGIRRFMLCQQGDFMQQFLMLIFDILDKPYQKIARHSIQNCIEEALKNSGANSLSKSITKKLSFISLKINLRESDKMKGWSIFSLSFQPSKPMDCLFHPSFMYSLSEIYNFLLNFRRCLYKITTMWTGKQQAAGERQQYSFYGLRNAMHHYVSVVLQYLTQQFSEAVSRYSSSIDSCCEFTQIMQANDDLIREIGKITVNQPILCNCLITLIELIDKFASEECDSQSILILHDELNSVVQTTRRIKKLEEMFFDNQYD